MANIKIAQLTNKTSLADTDLVIVESATQTQKMTVGKLKELLGIDGGGIVESGSNANGRYIKYADGTLICYGTINLLYTSPIACSETWTFPHAFISSPIVTTTTIGTFSGFTRNLSTLRMSNRSGTSVTMARNTIENGTDFQSSEYIYESVMAIGRWK